MSPSPSPSPLLIQVVESGSATEAPWWGVPVVAGAFLIAGALLGFLFNRLQDDRRMKREDRLRWDDRILERSAKFVQSAEELNAAVIHMLGRDVPEELVEKLDRDMSRQAAFLSLVVPIDLRDRVGDVVFAAIDVRYTSDPEERLAKASLLFEASTAYDAAVREYFGLASRKTPPT
jgi:hypothetical protein